MGKRSEKSLGKSLILSDIHGRAEMALPFFFDVVPLSGSSPAHYTHHGLQGSQQPEALNHDVLVNLALGFRRYVRFVFFM